MSKPIRMTQEFLKVIIPEIIQEISKKNMRGGSLKYEKSLSWNDNDRAKLIFDPMAYMKMKLLVANTSDEVAWHGVCKRDEKDPATFHISDIMVYPQMVTGSTVNTDQEAYQNWLMAHEDDVFNNIRMQGHSHVNMGVTPSPTDTTHQERILDMFTDDDIGGVVKSYEDIPDNRFYVFIIWNKRDEKFINIYDLKYNTLYETKDVDVVVSEDDEIGKFLKDASEKVKKSTTVTYSSGYRNYQGNGYGGYQGGYQTGGKGYQAPVTTKKTNAVTESKASGNVVNFEDYDFPDDDCYGTSYR